MIIVDVETSGVEPFTHSLLSIGAVDFNDPLSENGQFYAECRIWDGALIEEAALAVNGFTREQAADPAKKTDVEIYQEFAKWAMSKEEHTIAGQNPAFDRDFLKYTAFRGHSEFPFATRTVDLHSICYFHMIRKGLTPPVSHERSNLNSDTIMQYVGLPAEPKPHIAINGARIEAEAFHRLLKDKPLYTEFEQYPIPWLNVRNGVSNILAQ